MELMQMNRDPFAEEPNHMLETRIRKLRFCDIAAIRLNKIVPDTKLYLPLVKNREVILSNIRKQLVESPPIGLPESFRKFLSYRSSKRYYYLKPLIEHKQTTFDIERNEMKYVLKLPYFTFQNYWHSNEPVIIIRITDGEEGQKYCTCITNEGLREYLLNELHLNTE